METKNRVVKGSKVPSINLSKEILSLLTRLEDYEVKEILVGIRDYVYKDKEPSVDEEITDIMEMVLDNVNHIAAKHLNGSKGGRPRKTNTDIESNTEFDTEAKISPNEPDIDTNDIDVPQGAESVPEAKIEAKEEEIIIDTNNTEEMGTLIGTLSNFAIVETRDANSQKPMEELQRQTIERENGKKEYAATFNKAYNIQTSSVSEPIKRIEIEKDRSMEYMEKCLSIFDLSKAKRQISRAKSVDENMKRVEDCLDPLLVEFSKTERSRFYISIIEEVLNSK